MRLVGGVMSFHSDVTGATGLNPTKAPGSATTLRQFLPHIPSETSDPPVDSSE